MVDAMVEEPSPTPSVRAISSRKYNPSLQPLNANLNCNPSSTTAARFRYAKCRGEGVNATSSCSNYNHDYGGDTKKQHLLGTCIHVHLVSKRAART